MSEQKEWKQIRLPANPKDVNSGHLPIMVGSLRIFTADGKLIAVSTNRRATDPEGQKSLWGDIVSPDGKTKYGEVYYGESISLCGIVNIDTSLFTQYGSSLFFDYSVRQFSARYSPTPHIRMKIEPEDEWAEEILDVKLKSVKNLVEVLRPAHIVIELALVKKMEESIDEPEEELRIIGVQVLEDYPFDIWRKQGKLFDRKDYGEDSDTWFQYPGTRSGDGICGIVIDTMTWILDRPVIVPDRYGDYVRIKAIEDTYFDILPSEVAKLLGLPIGNNYTEVIGMVAGEYDISSIKDKVFKIRIGTKEYGKLEYSCDFSFSDKESMKAQEVAEFLRENLQYKIQEGRIWFKPLRSNVSFTLSDSACEVLGIAEGTYSSNVCSIWQSVWFFPEEKEKMAIVVYRGLFLPPISVGVIFDANVSYTTAEVVDIINTALDLHRVLTYLSAEAQISVGIQEKLKGHHPQHSRGGGNHIIMEVKDKVNYTFSLGGNAQGILGFPATKQTYYAGWKDEPFIFTNSANVIQVKVWFRNELIASSQNISFNVGESYTAQEVVEKILENLEGSGVLDYMDFTAVDDTEPYLRANPYEKLSIKVKSFLDEEYVPILRRDGGLYGDVNEEDIDVDIDYLYRNMAFPNLRDGMPYLRGRLVIEEQGT